MIDYQSFTNCVAMPCCVVSVEKRGNKYGEIRIVCANQAYKDIMGPAYCDGMIYSELVPRDSTFEDYVCRAAVLKQRIHAYVETKALGAWTDQTLIPLESDREDLGYCQIIVEFTPEAEAARLARVNLAAAEAALQAAIHLNLQGAEHYNEALKEALDVIIEAADAKAGRIIACDHESRRVNILCEKIRDCGTWQSRRTGQGKDRMSYELMTGWEEMIDDSNIYEIKDEQDMERLADLNPAWAANLRDSGVTSLILRPLRRDNQVIGYLYVDNFDVTRIVEVKELTELMGVFLTAEIANDQLLKQLERMSRKDPLTGVGNRRAMIERMHALPLDLHPETSVPFPYGIINIDLNGLKTVNDLEGHDAGDRHLVQAGEILRKIFYEEDLYRTGGDEFMVITRDIDRSTFDYKVERLHRDVEKNADISFAIGAYWNGGSDSVTDAFRKADEMMYKDKEAFYERNPELRR